MSPFLRKPLRLASKTIMLASSTCLITGPAYAADNILLPSWTGPYFGLHGSLNQRQVDIRNIPDEDDTGAMYGGHIGYNIGLGPVVLGIESEANYSGSSIAITTANGTTATLDADWTGSLRGRIGLPIGPALIYATAGWAWSNNTLVAKSVLGTSKTTETTEDGIVYGLGAETFLLPNISVRAEFLSIDYGTEIFSFTNTNAGTETGEAADRMFRLGISVHLN